MISISGIKYQKELETLPFLNKNQSRLLIGKKGRNLDKKLYQLKKKGYLMNLKKSQYVSYPYYQTVNKSLYLEYIANTLRSPSYISLEYILAKENLIPEAVVSVTSITTKSSRTYNNFLGTFIYRNIKKKLFFAYKQNLWEEKTIFRATKVKALFDLLYLKKLSNIKQEIIYDLRINWENFQQSDLAEFTEYVRFSKSKKMKLILEVIKSQYVS